MNGLCERRGSGSGGWGRAEAAPNPEHSRYGNVREYLTSYSTALPLDPVARDHRDGREERHPADRTVIRFET